MKLLVEIVSAIDRTPVGPKLGQGVDPTSAVRRLRHGCDVRADEVSCARVCNNRFGVFLRVFRPAEMIAFFTKDAEV
jgi:hypothetical protein